MRVEISFNDWSKSKLLSEAKQATSRSKPYGKKGDTFAVEFSADLTFYYTLLAVVQLPYWYIEKHLFLLEGAESPLAFRKVWKEIHPSFNYEKNKYDLKWIHFFKRGISE